MVAVEVALHNAIRLNKNVLVFSLEMSAGSFYERIIARIMKKSIYELRDMVKNGQQAVILQKIKDKLKEKILIIDKSDLSIKDVEERIALANTRMWKDGQTDFVILDYFQYLRASDFNEQEMAAKYTKVIAKKYNVIFFILSQLNRTGDSYKKPSIKMLKGSGALEASGDYVCLSWTPAQDPDITPEQYDAAKNHICMTIGKARRGALASDFELEFHPEISTIKDLSVKEVDDGESSVS
jgi:DNA primase